MKASRQFKEAPKPVSIKPKVKSRIRNGVCVPTQKIPYNRKKAENLATKWEPDERGKWSAYKCPYGKSHWHVGHIPKEVKP